MQILKINSATSLAIVQVLIATLILLIPALYNGYPFVDWDSGTYIGSAMFPNVPADRPAVYGWLIIRKSSWFDTLWLVIIFQNLVLAYLLRKFYSLIFSNNITLFIPFIAVITAFTSVGWYSNQIMPDIFTPILVLSFLSLHINKNQSIAEQLLLVTIMAISTAVHSSNLWILCLILIGFLLINSLIFKKAFFFKTYLLGLFAVFLGILLTLGIHFKIEGRWVYSKGAHVFLMGKMLDLGVLETFLYEYPEAAKYNLYQYRDFFKANTHRNFLFDEESPLYKSGGWEATKPEYISILKDICTKPKLVYLIIKNTTVCVISQLFQNEYKIPEGVVFKENVCPPTYMINRFFPHEAKSYLYSRQAHNLWNQTLDFSIISVINYFVFICSGIFLVCFYTFASIRALFNTGKIELLAYVLIAIVSNAIVTASLASVCYRFQSRISWLLPTMLLLFIFKKLNGKPIKIFTTE